MEGVKLLEEYFGSKASGDRVKLLLTLDRLWLTPSVPLVSAVKRLMMEPSAFLIRLREERKYRQIVTELLQEAGIGFSVGGYEQVGRTQSASQDLSMTCNHPGRWR